MYVRVFKVLLLVLTVFDTPLLNYGMNSSTSTDSPGICGSQGVARFLAETGNPDAPSSTCRVAVTGAEDLHAGGQGPGGVCYAIGLGPGSCRFRPCAGRCTTLVPICFDVLAVVARGLRSSGVARYSRIIGTTTVYSIDRFVLRLPAESTTRCSRQRDTNQLSLL